VAGASAADRRGGIAVVRWLEFRPHARAAFPLRNHAGLTAAVALGLAPLTDGHLALTVACFMVAFGGLKAYLPAFWAMPRMFLAGPAAAGSIGLINSLGNLGGFFGPAVLGQVQKVSGSFVGGIYYPRALDFPVGADPVLPRSRPTWTRRLSEIGKT
jgi:hypothetical protein